MIELLKESIVAAWRQGRILWPWALGLLAVDLAIGLPGGEVLGSVQAAIGFVVSLVVSWRFYAAHLGQDWRAIATDRGQLGRYVLWYCFLQGLPLVLLTGATAVKLPPPVIAVMTLGVGYFSLRLTALLPAIIAWRAWPGIDRVWVPSAPLVWRILGLVVVVLIGLMFALMIVALVGAVALAAFLNKDALKHVSQHVHDHPLATGLAASVWSWIATQIGFAFDVRCLWLIAPPSRRPPSDETQRTAA